MTDATPSASVPAANAWVSVAVVIASVATVCAAAYVHNSVVVGVELELRLFTIPATVGTVFGVLLALVLRTRRRVVLEKQRALVGEAEVARLNRDLERLVAERTEQLRVKEAALHQAQKMEAVGQLASGVAHDFNNLLTAILGWSDLLAVITGNEPKTREALSELRKAGLRAAALTRRLLALGRSKALRPELVEVGALTQDLLPLLHTLLGERVQLLTELPAEPLWLLVERSRFESVVLNLAVNARDAMEHGGTFTIRARRSSPADATSTVTLEFSDTGCGMSPAVRARIFEPFFTTKPAGRGTGLGLAIVHDAVELWGGRLEVTTAVGAGTTFALILPTGDERRTVPRPSVPSAATAAPVPAQGVLVIDDDDAVRRLVDYTLARSGYRVFAASDPREAEQTLLEHINDIQMIVSDVVLPHEDGPQLVARWRRTHPDLGIVLMSGDDASWQDRLPAELADTPLLAKPFEPAALLAALSQVTPR